MNPSVKINLAKAAESHSKQPQLRQHKSTAGEKGRNKEKRRRGALCHYVPHVALSMFMLHNHVLVTM